MKKKVTNNGGVTAIYVRRSVADRDNNSLSIESMEQQQIHIQIMRVHFLILLQHLSI